MIGEVASQIEQNEMDSRTSFTDVNDHITEILYIRKHIDKKHLEKAYDSINKIVLQLFEKIGRHGEDTIFRLEKFIKNN